MSLPERHFIPEVGLERVGEIEVCARPLQARLGIVQIRKKPWGVSVRIRAVVREDFAEGIARLEV